MGNDWEAVAKAINARLEELGMTQRELAERSDVSPATLRQLQNNYGPRKRSPRLLAAVSEGLRWTSGHLAEVLDGDAPESVGPDSLRQDVAQLREEVRELRERLEAVEERPR